jgi:hypothetical protein
MLPFDDDSRKIVTYPTVSNDFCKDDCSSFRASGTTDENVAEIHKVEPTRYLRLRPASVSVVKLMPREHSAVVVTEAEDSRHHTGAVRQKKIVLMARSSQKRRCATSPIGHVCEFHPHERGMHGADDGKPGASPARH